MSVKTKIAKYFRYGLTLISPKLNTKVVYRAKFKRPLNLENPQTFNEKSLWLKLNTYYKNPLIKQCADKYAVREYIEKKGFGYTLNNLIATYTDPEKIDWDALPDTFAIKLNSGCGHNLMVTDKSKLDKKKTVKKLKKWMRDKWTYLGYSEMQYKDVEPIILIEDYLGTPDGTLPTDYKFFCMNGKCRGFIVCVDRVIGEHANYYFMDKNWKILPYTSSALEEPDKVLSKPDCIDEAIKIAEGLSKDFPQVRVDLYILGDKIYFGELTFTTAGAMWTELNHKIPGTDRTVDEELGSYITLPRK